MKHFPPKVAIAAALFVSCSVLHVAAAPSGSEANPGPNDESSLQPYGYVLANAGQKLGCFFTIETLEDPINDQSCFNGLQLIDEQPATRAALIAKLHREIPGAAIIVDQNDPRILHLVENRLLGDKRYPMARRISVSFAGELGELADVIGKAAPGIKARSGGSLTDAFDDFITNVRLRTCGLDVRQTLTVAVPLKQYGALLWKATTYDESGKLITQVQYYGPRDDLVLDMPLVGNLAQMKLGEALERLGKLSQTEIKLWDSDTMSLSDVPVKPITLGSNGTLRSALHAVLDPVGLSFLASGKEITVYKKD